MNKNNAEKISRAWERMQRERWAHDNRKLIITIGLLIWVGLMLWCVS